LVDKFSIRDDPFICDFLAKLPVSASSSFSDEQLIALKAALAGRTWGVHTVDIRRTVKIWHWQYYFVFLFGRNRRSLSRKQLELSRFFGFLLLAFFIVLFACFVLMVVYLLKSALGFDFFPGYSFGVWSWFKNEFLH